MDRDRIFEELRPLLGSLAYRMLGSVGESEDIVQEVYLRWSGVEEAIDSPKAYLSTVTTRLCIDHLRSARVRRETYVGTWLPEPLITETGPDASAHVEQADSLSMAFLVLLESLSPVERAIFLLREVFSYDYSDIAEMVGKTEDNCRQIARRAKKHVESRRPRFETDRAKQEEMTYRFMQACAIGDLAGLEALLTEDITLFTDGGGKVRAARKPIYGRNKVARFVMGVLGKAPEDMIIRIVEVNGAPGIAIFYGGEPGNLLALDVAHGTIQGISIVLNPDKLGGLRELA
jgi:RNA polymerase sigma-70 factor (ECF subfamily)